MTSGLKSAALASVLLLIGGSAAWAQTSGSNPGTQTPGTQTPGTQTPGTETPGTETNVTPGAQSGWGQSSPGGNISADTQQKIRQSLAQSGFKDIRVVPESFVVRAQAPDGSRIVMLLSPDQISEMVMSNANQGMQGNSSQPSAGQSNSQAGNGNGLNMTQQQAQQELSRYGYSNMQDVTPMRGWVADATKNGEQVHVMLSDNGLVATFPGR